MSDTPARYRKRPVDVTAVRWTGDNFGVIEAFAGWSKHWEGTSRTAILAGDDVSLWIEKSQTRGTVRKGDWVIAERDGDGFYPCTAEQFTDTYEPVEE